jgi:hypothetical protein
LLNDKPLLFIFNLDRKTLYKFLFKIKKPLYIIRHYVYKGKPGEKFEFPLLMHEINVLPIELSWRIVIKNKLVKSVFKPKVYSLFKHISVNYIFYFAVDILK